MKSSFQLIIIGLVLAASSLWGQTNLIAPFSETSPTIDGVINASEWQNAQTYDLTFHSNVDQTTMTVPVYLLNDGTFLYCASTVPFPVAPTAFFGLYIDGDHSHSINGAMSESHTDLGYNKAGTDSPLYPIYDAYWAEVPPCGVLWEDMVTPPEGAEHAYTGTSELSYELKIPLSDMTAAPGETIGIHLQFSPGGVSYMYPSADYCDIASWPDLLIEAGQQLQFEFIHITDIHVGDSGAAARFAQMVDAINTLDPAPAFVVMTGDLVAKGGQSTGVANFQMFRSIANGLDMDYYTCPGNHETYPQTSPPQFWSTENYENELNKLLNWRLSPYGINLISLYSGHDESIWDCCNIPGLCWFRDGTGEGSGLTDLQNLQLFYLKEWLTSSFNMPAVVFMHHPIVSYRTKDICNDEKDDTVKNGCIFYNRQYTWELLQDPNQDGDDTDAAKLLLVGHHHENHVYESDNIHQPSSLQDNKAPVETRNHPDDLPLHVLTADVVKTMTYRRIGVDGSNFTVYPPTTLRSTTNIVSRTTSFVGKSLSNDSILYPAARLHAYDSHGNHVGPNDMGDIDMEITGALYHQDDYYDTLNGITVIDGELISLYISEDEYRYEFKAETECNLSVEGELSRQDGTGKKLYYDSVAVVGGSRVTAFVTSDSIGPYLSMDYDGDGTPESQISPDSIVSYGFIYGDANGDGTINVGDAVHIINYVFKGGPAPDPEASGDANCDTTINVGDAVHIINYVFKGGPKPGCL